MGDGILLARIILAVATVIFALAVVQSAKAKTIAHRLSGSFIAHLQSDAPR